MQAPPPSPPIDPAALNREERVTGNTMPLRALYLGSQGGNGAAPSPAMALALQASLGSVERWREEFVAMAMAKSKAPGEGSGWVLLTFQPREGTLLNQWASDHAPMAADGVPILALDMHEHAHDGGHGAAAGPGAPGWRGRRRHRG